MNKKQQNLLLEENLLTIDKFNADIENSRNNHDTYLEAIVEYCTQHNIEINIVKKLLNSQILSKLCAECERLNLINRTSFTNPLF